MRASRQLRAQVVRVSRLLGQRGWVANHDGNITARLSPDRYLATPTATSKRLVDDALLIEVDGEGKRISGTARPFGELDLHLGIYQCRDDVNAVVHAHPPHATAIACSPHNVIERPFIAEAVVSIGALIPRLGFAMPGPAARRALMSVAEHVDAALLCNHGVIAWGADIEQAYLRLELIEHLARVAILAQPVGGVTPLPDSAVAELLQKRARAGLGKAADRAADSAGMPAGPMPAAPGTDRGQLVQVIREELLRALGE
jgi:L-fuculose-phosphate aldolase